MRKYLIAAVTACTAVACTGVAQAQNPAPAPKMTVKVTPGNAGTKKKPKSSKVRLKIENNVESKTTMSKLRVDLGANTKLNGRGLTRCSKTVLEADPSDCPRASRAGSGIAHALVGPHEVNPTRLTLDVDAFIGGTKVLLIRVEGREIPVVGLIEARITRGGRRLTLTIPDNLQEPAENVFSALVDLETTLSRKKGRNALFSTTGCKGGKHTTKATLTYAPNPVPPAETTATTTASSRCSK